IKVTPTNFHKIRPHIDWWDNEPSKFKNAKLIKKKLDIPAKKNRWYEYELDPAALLGTKAGPGMYYVEIGSKEVDAWPYRDGGVKKALVNFTDIGVVSKLSPSRGLVWATKLSTGEPLPGALVSVRNMSGKQTWSGRTDTDGIAMLPAKQKLIGKVKEGQSSALRIFVSNGEDWTMLDPAANGGTASWNFNVSSERSTTPEQLRGFMHTDRGLYRPGETVHMKGLARVTTLGAPLSVPKSRVVELQVRGPRGTTTHQAKVRLSKLDTYRANHFHFHYNSRRRPFKCPHLF
ncbi:MAG: hypothetical protein IIB17_04315, partial [Chloroflexi bacterium]|nr:hypothetical protein [Chloroflexota bacterium]